MVLCILLHFQQFNKFSTKVLTSKRTKKYRSKDKNSYYSTFQHSLLPLLQQVNNKIIKIVRACARLRARARALIKTKKHSAKYIYLIVTWLSDTRARKCLLLWTSFSSWLFLYRPSVRHTVCQFPCFFRLGTLWLFLVDTA